MLNIEPKKIMIEGKDNKGNIVKMELTDKDLASLISLIDLDALEAAEDCVWDGRCEEDVGIEIGMSMDLKKKYLLKEIVNNHITSEFNFKKNDDEDS